MEDAYTSDNYCDFVKKGEGIAFGTWVWDRNEIFRPEPVFEFLTKNGINEIYLVYAPEIGKESYRTFIAQAGLSGIRVSLIGAEAEWVLPRGQEGRDAFFAFYEDYQNTAAEAERFYGMHMDIEPHQLEEWKKDNEGTVKGYCDFVLLAGEVADRTGTILELDIPCWYENHQAKDSGESIPLCDFCVRHADTVLFMSYRDNAQAAAEFADYGIKAGLRYHKKISLAFETGKIYEEVNITFDHVGAISLNRELHRLREIMESTFPDLKAGYAVHHYNSWAALPPCGNPKAADFPYDNPNYAHLL